MRQITIGELVDFIQCNKKNGVFREYTNEQLIKEILWCVKNNTLCYSQNMQGKLNGVTTGQVESDEIFYVRNVLTTDKDAFKPMILWFIKQYPNYSITSHSHKGKERMIFTPDKLLKRLSIQHEH